MGSQDCSKSEAYTSYNKLKLQEKRQRGEEKDEVGKGGPEDRVNELASRAGKAEDTKQNQVSVMAEGGQLKG